MLHAAVPVGVEVMVGVVLPAVVALYPEPRDVLVALTVAIAEVAPPEMTSIMVLWSTLLKTVAVVAGPFN